MAPANSPNRSKIPLYEAIAKDLAQSIQDGQLAAGEKLPPHRVLALRLSVTTATVSKAYAHLETQGLVTARIGDGTYVRSRIEHANSLISPHGAPSPIDLAHNVPVRTEEAAALAGAFAAISRDSERMSAVLSYQPETGAKHHRMAGAQWLKRFGTDGDWSRVLVTHGAQHALAGVLRTVARPGDALLTESLTYPGLLTLAKSLRLQVIGVETDKEGLIPDALDKAAQTFQTKLLYCTPTLHSPSTSTMSVSRRKAVAAVIRKRGLLLMEDVVHAAILELPPPAIASFVPEQSFLLSSLSKVLAPGLRVGYLEAAPQWLDKIAASIRADCWMVAPLMPEIATQWLQTGESDRLIGLQRRQIENRLELVHSCLAGFTYQYSAYHPHVWLPLPEPWSAAGFSQALRQEGVLVRMADQFAAGRAPVPHAVRISLNTASSLEQLQEGLETVARVLAIAPSEQYQDLPRTPARRPAPLPTGRRHTW